MIHSEYTYQCKKQNEGMAWFTKSSKTGCVLFFCIDYEKHLVKKSVNIERIFPRHKIQFSRIVLVKVSTETNKNAKSDH